MLPDNPVRARLLADLGRRLRSHRLLRNDTQAVFARRIGISERSLRLMEAGAPTIPIGVWLDALDVLGQLARAEELLPLDPFAPTTRAVRTRQRARRPRTVR